MGRIKRIGIKGKISKIALRIRRACVLPVGYLLLINIASFILFIYLACLFFVFNKGVFNLLIVCVLAAALLL